MKQILILILIFLKTFFCLSQEYKHGVISYFHPFGINKNDLELSNLKSNVKSINETNYTLIDSFGFAVKKSKIPNRRTITNFNKKGQFLEVTVYKNKKEYKRTYIYNKKDKRIESKTYYRFKDSLILSSIIKLNYSQNQLINKQYYSVPLNKNQQLDSTRNYTYNKNHTLKETKVFLPDKSIKTKTIYKYYNDQNLGMVIIKYSKNGDMSKIIREYKKPKKTIIELYKANELLDTEIVLYDENEFIITKQAKDVDNIYEKLNYFTYNKNGHTLKEIEKLMKYGVEDYEKELSMSFNYDEYNNWIKSIISANVFSFKALIERDITYFK